MNLLDRKRPRRAVLGLVAAVATVAASLGMAVSADAASEGVVAGEGSPTSISGSYIVVLKDGVTTQSVDGQANGLTARFGGKVTRTYSSALRGFAVSMGARQARRLAADPAVARVEQDQRVTTSGVQSPTPSWGLDRIDQRNLPLDNSYTYPNTASNVHAYIIDTGIYISHSDFGGRASVGTDAVGDGRNGIDCNGHGTHVSGTVGGSTYGVAKGVTLVAVRVLDCNGSGTYTGVIQGIDWVTANAIKPAVANMSLGGGFSQAVNDAVTRSMNSGVTYALAAGNSSADACNSSPSSTPGAVTVGATDSSDNQASFSNYGTCLALYAPGVSITSDWNTNNTATNTISGTSMASPHAAGAAALYLSANPSSSAAQVRTALVNNATSGVVKSPGSGSPNKLLFVGSGSPPPPPPPPPSGGITNGGFETGNLTGWTPSGTAGVTTSGPHSGTYAALLGGTSPTNGDSSISQTFAAPSGTTTLSFWYNVTCPDTLTYDWATATLTDNTTGTTSTVLSPTCVSSSGWLQVTASVVAGHSYTLNLINHDDNYPGDPTYTTFDDVTLS